MMVPAWELTGLDLIGVRRSYQVGKREKIGETFSWVSSKQHRTRS